MDALFGYGNFLLLMVATALTLVVCVVGFLAVVLCFSYARYKFVQQMLGVKSAETAKRYVTILAVTCALFSHLAISAVLLWLAPGLLEKIASGGNIYVLAPVIAAIAVMFFVVVPLVLTSRENDRAIGDWKRGVSSF